MLPFTPHRRSSSSSSSTPISASGAKQLGSQARKQENLIADMKSELCDALYESDQLFDKIFPAHPDVDLITKRVKKARTTSFPTNGPESRYYEPFAELLNTIIDVMDRLGLLTNEHIYKHLRFETYDRPMGAGTDTDDPLKPDLIARQRDPSNSKRLSQSASWKEVEFCVEVKDQWAPLIAQAATYARCILAFQRNRRFVPVIFFRHTTMEVKFGVYTASWVCVSRTPLGVAQNSDSFKTLVGEVARIIACKTRWSAGFDVTCNNQLIHIPGAGLYEFKENMCNRQTVRGRRTRVDLIAKVDGKSKTGKTESTQAEPPKGRYFLRNLPNGRMRSQQSGSEPTSSQNNLAVIPEDQGNHPIPKTKASKNRSGKTQQTAAKPDVDFAINSIPVEEAIYPADLPVSFPDQEGSSKVPRVLIVKDSWPMEHRTTEGDMFGQFKGQFGLPDMLTYDPVFGPDGQKDETSLLLPIDAVALSLWESRPPAPNVDNRIHMRIIFRTIGKPLTTARGPKQLVLGVLHAILGHWVLFKGGWLHRDVSIGNVMLMETSTSLPFENEFDIPDKYLKECTAFITDGDLAVPYAETNRSTGTRRSGTPPFISCFLLDTMGSDVLHTAADDLESFVWVLLWAIMDTSKVKPHLNNHEISRVVNILFSASIETLERRRAIYTAVSRRKALSRAFTPFAKILIDWLRYAHDTEEERLFTWPEEISDPITFFMPYYQEYLRLGFQALENLPDNWEYITSVAS